MLLITMFGVFGCAEIEYIRTVDSYNTIMDKLVIKLDKNKLGSNYSTVKNSVYDDLIIFRNHVYNWIDSFEEVYPEVYEDLKEGILCQIVDDVDNELSLIVEFANWYCFGVFYGYYEESEFEYCKAMNDIGPFIKQILNQDYQSEEMNIFLYKYSMIKQDNIKSIIDKFTIDEIETIYYDKYKDMTGYSLNDIDLSQVFAYPDDRIYSNADVKEVVEGITFLAWDLSDKNENFQMTIYKVAPHAYVWYITGLIISAIVVVVLFIVIGKKYKNEIKIIITKQEAEKNE